MYRFDDSGLIAACGSRTGKALAALSANAQRYFSQFSLHVSERNLLRFLNLNVAQNGQESGLGIVKCASQHWSCHDQSP